MIISYLFSFQICKTSSITLIINVTLDLQRQLKQSWEMKTLWHNRKEILEIKNTITRVNNVFNLLLCRPGTAKERISDLEDRLIETSQTKCNEKQIMEKTNKQKKQTNRKEQNRNWKREKEREVDMQSEIWIVLYQK